eukprot:TRINITY_DN1323_c0_g1_i2.p1 TRINITY_DN1323_c0_g1~~TRINITY_DN1323_c0_g1_i2.p1  ORF type:complete len:214 (+),score=18.15 TRINITY_DN1323_c0_g1_i2:99-740(+)
MSLVVYGVSSSTSVRRVLVSLAEKGVTDYKLELIVHRNGEHKKPEYLAIQPFGLIPALKDGEFIIYESRAISRYIDEKFEGQGTDLLGSTLQQRGLVNQWLDVESGTFHPAISGLNRELMVRKRRGEEPDISVVEPLLTELNSVLDVYEKHLAITGFEYLTGSNFTLADLSHLPHTHRLVNDTPYADVITSRPHLAKWWERISTRDSWKSVST